MRFPDCAPARPCLVVQAQARATKQAQHEAEMAERALKRQMFETRYANAVLRDVKRGKFSACLSSTDENLGDVRGDKQSGTDKEFGDVRERGDKQSGTDTDLGDIDGDRCMDRACGASSSKDKDLGDFVFDRGMDRERGDVLSGTDKDLDVDRGVDLDYDGGRGMDLEHGDTHSVTNKDLGDYGGDGGTDGGLHSGKDKYLGGFDGDLGMDRQCGDLQGGTDNDLGDRDGIRGDQKRERLAAPIRLDVRKRLAIPTSWLR